MKNGVRLRVRPGAAVFFVLRGLFALFVVFALCFCLAFAFAIALPLPSPFLMGQLRVESGKELGPVEEGGCMWERV